MAFLNNLEKIEKMLEQAAEAYPGLIAALVRDFLTDNFVLKMGYGNRIIERHISRHKIDKDGLLEEIVTAWNNNLIELGLQPNPNPNPPMDDREYNEIMAAQELMGGS